jgi:hypothetical protein
MADEAVKLQKLANYATAVGATCGRILGDSLSGDPATSPSREVCEQVEYIRRLAAEAQSAASSAVRIGVVGGFSAGKTLLLGAMIGYADALPQDEEPVTGNITALHFELNDDLQTTEVDPFEVEFLDHDGFADCLRFMLAEASRRATAAQFPPELVKPLGGVNPPDPATHGALEGWGRAAWSTCTNNPGFRNLIRELLTFTRAYRQCGVGLCGAKLKIPRDAVRHGLTLANAKQSVQEMSFDDIPPAPAPISSQPDELTSETLRAAFPLVRRVTARVRLSKQIWDFSELTGSNPFVLLDFPGLGAADSGVRDLYLCRRELAEVQTILILLDGKKSGGNEGNQLVDLLAENRRGRDIKDAVLVGIGRFDSIPLHKDGEDKLVVFAGGPAKKTPAATVQLFTDDEDEAPVALKGLAAGKLTEADVLDGLPILNTCLRVAESVVRAGRRDRVVLLSPLLHLHSLKQKYGDVLKVGSEKFLRYLDKEAEHGLHLQKLMKGVADRLERDTPGSRSKPGLTRSLDDFAADGGINRLRKLIQSHVQDHGLSQLLEDSRIKAGDLREALKVLAGMIEPRPGSGDLGTQDDRLAKFEKRFRQLLEFYSTKRAEIDKAPPLCMDREGREVEVAAVVHQETVHQIFEWAQWSRLLQASRDGIITEPQGDEAIFKDEDGEEDDEGVVADSFPTKSDDFLPAFERTLDAMQVEVRKSVRRGVQDTVQRWNRDPNVAPSREDLAGPLADKSLTRRLRALGLGVQGAGLVNALRAAVNPERLTNQILPEDGPDPLERSWSRPTDIFPLALRGARGDAGLEFAWASKFQKAAQDSRPDVNRSHQSLVLRLRDEFVTTVSREMTEAVAVATYRINQRIKNTLSELVGKLKVVTSRQDVLAELVRDKPEGTESEAGAQTDPLALVRQLAGTHWPLDDPGSF